MSRNKSDTSKITRPIELGTSLNEQILDARATATREAIDYLENDCDLILECRMCRSLFRSLANFISHKRIFCQGRYQLQRAELPLRRNPVMTVVMPEGVDDNGPAPVTSRSSDAKKSLGSRRKPTRKPISLVQAVLSQSQAQKDVSVKSIPDVNAAVTQTITKKESSGSTPSEISNNNDITVVEPKDGYPNMSLRDRSGKESKISMEDYIDFYDEETGDDIPTVIPEADDSMTGPGSPLSAAEKHPYCDLRNLRCRHCKFSYSSARSLKVHITNYHSATKKIWVCPLCRTHFCQYWGVSRHLKRLHGITDGEMAIMKKKIKYKIVPHDENTKSKQNGKEDLDPENSSAKRDPDIQPGSSQAEHVGLSETFRCNFCRRLFAKESHLKLHKAACSKKAEAIANRNKTTTKVPNLFVCQECNCAFDKKEKKDTHICGRTGLLKTAGISDLNAAADSDSDGRPRPHTCEVCFRRFTMVQNMKQHRMACRRRHGLPADDMSVNDSEPETAELKNFDIKSDTLDVIKQSDDVLEVQSAEEGEKSSSDSPLAQNRPKRNIKPKKFHDGTNAPDVVKIQQADGSICYKLREDVGLLDTNSQPKQVKSETLKTADPPRPRDGRVTRKQFQGDIIPKLDDEQEVKLSALIDSENLTCKQSSCKGKQFVDMASLRRHAVRHLGWERYKCKMCEYTTEDKVECKAHLRDRHPHDVSTLLDSGLQEYILDIGEEESELMVDVLPVIPTALQPAPSPKRGRPPSSQLKIDTGTPKSGGSSTRVSPAVSSSQSPKQIVKGKRPKGRPRKYPRVTPQAANTAESDLSSSQDSLSLKKSADENKRKATSSSLPSTPAKVSRSESSPGKPGVKQQSKLEFLLTKIRSRRPLASDDSNGSVTMKSEQSKSNSKDTSSK